MRKSFINPLIETDVEDAIFKEEYYTGLNKNLSNEELAVREQTVRQFEYKMKTLHNWTKDYLPAWFGAHECSEMIVNVGKLFFSDRVVAYH